jgi:hypothetical protein
MRQKNEPTRRKRVRAQQDAEDDERGGEEGAADAPQHADANTPSTGVGGTLAANRRRAAARRRVGAPSAVEAVEIGADDGELLGSADLLFCAPALAAAPAAEDGGSGSGAARTRAQLKAAPGRPGRLLVVWDGPEAPQVEVQAPSEAAAAALLQLLASNKLGASLRAIPWPGGSGSGSLPPPAARATAANHHQHHHHLPAARVFRSSHVAEAALAAAGDVVTLPVACGGDGDGGLAGATGRVAAPAEDPAGTGDVTTQRHQQEGGEEDEAAAAGDLAEEGSLEDPSDPLQPSRLVSFLAGTLAPQLLLQHGGSSAGEGEAAGTEGLQLWRLRLGVTRQAFGQGAATALDPARRPWQQWLLAVASWLAPQWGVVPPANARDEEEDDEGEAGGGAREAGQEAAAAAGGEAAGPSTSAAAATAAPSPPTSAGTAQQPAPAAAASGQPEFDASVLYAWAKPSGLEPRVLQAEAPPLLLPTLRPYQARAVRWMLERERAPVHPAGLFGRGGGKEDGGDGYSSGNSSSESDGEEEGEAEAGGGGGVLHPLWRHVRVLPGGFARRFFLNPFSGLVSKWQFEAPPPVRGECGLAVLPRVSLDGVVVSCLLSISPNKPIVVKLTAPTNCISSPQPHPRRHRSR